MKMLTKIVIILLGVIFLAACQNQDELPLTFDLEGTNWVLSSLNGQLPAAGTTVTLNFGEDGSVGGSDGCNSFGTTYTLEGVNLTINQPIASTMMACEEPVMNQASAYMTMLENTIGFIASGNQLNLIGEEGVLATFIAAEADTGEEAPQEPPVVEESPEMDGDLAGSGWLLSALNGEAPIPGTTAFLLFGEEGALSGSNSCNNFNTTYTQDGSSLMINPQGASTLMACEEPVMQQADAFMEALANTTNFTMNEDELQLQNGDQVLATFTYLSNTLEDTAWQVISYNNGREAVVSVLLGTEITANFGTEGDVTGNAGCNEYFASFTTSDGTIEIGDAGTTLRFCTEPEGVMEQEAEYLVALQSAATYSVRGLWLEMRTADDALAVIMTRKLEIDLPEPDPSMAIGRVNAPQGLNVRSGPGTNYPIIGYAEDGDVGEIVGRSADNRWWAVAIPSAPDGVGWVSADFVIASNTENVPVLETAPPVVVVPTSAATSTPVPPPSATPSAQISFGADRTNINQGECTTLRWSVENIQAVWVYPQGEPFENYPRTGQGSEQVCPQTTTTYEMRVQQRDGLIVFRQVTVNVSGPTATATGVPPTATPTTVPATATPVPTATTAADPLVGTRWQVVNYNNGEGGFVSVIADTLITMEFSAGGQVSGSAGCNNYFASYSVNGSSISVGLPSSGLVLCDEPEGTMEQEGQFLAALQSAATFTVNGGRLEMRTAGDQNAIMATQLP